MVDLVSKSMQKLSIDQYKTEERSILVKRLKSFHERINHLLIKQHHIHQVTTTTQAYLIQH